MTLAYLESGGISPVTILLLLVLLYLLPVSLVAMFAQRKGHSFGLFFLVGLLLSWIGSLIIALIVEDKRIERQVIVNAPATELAASTGQADELQKLSDLHESGALSAEEFERAKGRLLAE